MRLKPKLTVDLSVNVRRIPCVDIKEKNKKTSLIGKKQCYFEQMGSMDVCIKVLSIGIKYRCLFYSEAKIFSFINNLPWVHALSDDSNKIAITHSIATRLANPSVFMTHY